MFANTQMMGIDIGFPDVCMTPPVAAPIPYPNFGMGPMAVPAAYNILLFFTPAHNMFSTVPITRDQPGVMLGVAFGPGHGTVTQADRGVHLHHGLRPADAHDELRENNTNCPGVRLVP